MRHRTIFASALLILLLATLCGCQRERRTNVMITGQNNPEFHFKGSGKLAYFAVYSPSYASQAREPNDFGQAIWLVVPKRDARPVEQIGHIQYGTLPEGYTQEKPTNRVPEPLLEGKQYYFHVDTWDAPGVSGYVQIHGGKATAVEGEHVCFGSENGKWVRKPCN
jgi:hypothetical protein